MWKKIAKFARIPANRARYAGEVRQLDWMSDRMLADIGVHRGDIRTRVYGVD
jgi:uncharacterized protein YjiS (DUF1127 family)